MNENSLNVMKRKLEHEEFPATFEVESTVGQPSTSTSHEHRHGDDTIDYSLTKKRRNGNITQQIEADSGIYSQSLLKLNEQVKIMDGDKNKAIKEALHKMGRKNLNTLSSQQNSKNTDNVILSFTCTASDNDSVGSNKELMQEEDSGSMITIGTMAGINNRIVNIENVGQYNVDYSIENVEDFSEIVDVEDFSETVDVEDFSETVDVEIAICSEEEAVVSPMEKAIVSPMEKAIVSPMEKAIVSPMEKAIASPMENEIVSPMENEIVSPMEKAIVSPIGKEIVPSMQKEIVSPMEKEIVSPMEKAVVCPMEKEIVSTVEKEISAETIICPQEALYQTVCQVEKQQKRPGWLEPEISVQYGEIVYPEEVTVTNPEVSAFEPSEEEETEETSMVQAFDFANMLTVKEEIPDGNQQVWLASLNDTVERTFTCCGTNESVERQFPSINPCVSNPSNSECPPVSNTYDEDVLEAVITLTKKTQEMKSKVPRKRRARKPKALVMNMTKMAVINSNEKSPPVPSSSSSSSSAAQSATSSSGSPTDSRYQGLEEHTNESSDPSCIIVEGSNSNEEHIVSDLGEMAKSASTSQQRCGEASGNSVKIPPPRCTGDEQRFYYFDQWLLHRGLTNHDRNSHPTVSIDADNELKLLQCYVLFPYPTADQVQTLANALDVNRQTVRDWFTRKRLTNAVSWSEAEVSYARSHLYKRGKPKIAEHHNNVIEKPKGAASTVEVNKEHATAGLQAQTLFPQQGNKQQQQHGSGVPAVRTISLETNPSPPSLYHQQQNIVLESNVILSSQQQQPVQPPVAGSTYHYQPSNPPGRHNSRSNMPTMPEQQMQASFPNYQINQPNQVQEIVQSSSQWANGFCRPPSYVASNLNPTLLPSNPHTNTQQQQQQYGVMYMKQPINPRLQQPNQQQQPPAGSSMIYHRYADQPGLQQPTANMNQIMRHPLNGSQQQPTLVAPTKNNQFMVNGGQRPTSSDNNHRQNSSSQDPDGGASLFVYQFPGNPQQSSFIPANGAVAQQQQGVGEKGQFTHHITNNAPTLRSSDALAKKKFVGKKIDSHFLQYWPDGLGCNLLCSCNFTHSIDVDKYCLIVNLALQPFNTYQVAKPELEKCSYRPKENILPPCCVQSLFYIVRMRLLPKESLGVPATWSMESEQFDRRQADWSSFSNEQLLHLNEYFINCPYPSLPGFLPIIKKSRVSRNFIQTYFYTIRRHIKMFVENQYGDGDKYGHIYSSMDLWKSKKGDCDKVHTFCMRVVFGDTDKKKSDYFRKAFEK